MIPRNIFCWLAAICCLGAAICDTCRAQSPAPENQQDPLQAEKTERVRADNLNDEKESSGVRLPKAAPENELGLALLKNLLNDQKAIWTSPAHLRLGDATWLVPFAGRTAGFLVTDQDASSHLSHTPSTLSHYTNFSNYGLAGMAGAGAGLYFFGKVTHDEHKRETGFLSGEAALDALFVSTAVGLATGRERPPVNNFQGKFWQGGDSFPSSHAATAWAIASVISHEYPGPLTKILAYGAATAITYARVRGKKHFPADAFVSTGVGWLTGWQVYRVHHNTELGGAIPKNLSDKPPVETDRTPRQMGSPYVPLDSWIYPLFDRLIATGAINDASVRADYWLSAKLGASALVQYEQWRFPLLAAGLQKSVTASLQITHWPETRKPHKARRTDKRASDGRRPHLIFTKSLGSFDHSLRLSGYPRNSFVLRVKNLG